MKKQDIRVKDYINTRLLKGILTGAAIGGLVGALAGFLYPGLGLESASVAIGAAVAKTALGLVTGGGIGGLISFPAAANYPVSAKKPAVPEPDQTLQMREEQLEIAKK